MRACHSGSSADRALNTPTRRMRSPCCARAAREKASVAPLRAPRNSRRLMSALRLRRGIVTSQRITLIEAELGFERRLVAPDRTSLVVRSVPDADIAIGSLYLSCVRHQ